MLDTPLSEGPRPLAFLVSEASGRRSRAVVTVEEGFDLEPGTVFGIRTVTGRAVPVDPAAEDGSQDPAGVLAYAARAARHAVKVTAITRDAELAAHALIWPDAVSAEDRDAMTDTLAARGLILR
ncbi:head decoration protein [Fodinicurvata sp. EGI_FJ10296]|uniref:head decoration protein n=1 Tax=Fodinicurvata sp. EGI_FJ10296 TaxID=3231908 RepID=UPI00345230F7